jgi:hypothetical protein
MDVEGGKIIGKILQLLETRQEESAKQRDKIGKIFCWELEGKLFDQ